LVLPGTFPLVLPIFPPSDLYQWTVHIFPTIVKLVTSFILAKIKFKIRYCLVACWHFHVFWLIEQETMISLLLYQIVDRINIGNA
jgi:hypothetical protein